MAPAPDDIDTRKLTLGAHLEELRGHVFKCVLWLIAAFTVCLCFQEKLMQWATWPHIKTMARVERDAVDDFIDKELTSKSADAARSAVDEGTALEKELREVDRNRAAYAEKISSEPGKRLADLAARERGLTERARAIKEEQRKLLDRPDAARWEELEKRRVALVEEAADARKAVQQEVAPLLKLDAKFPRLELTQLSYMESFMAYMKVSLACALFLASPLIGRQLWQFVAAGLHRHEKRWVRIFFPVSILAFAVGAAFGYYVLIPAGLRFLATYGADYIVGQFALSEYLSLFINLTLVVGLIFELPLVMTFLSLVGLVKANVYGRYRRYWILAATIIAAIISPTPDPFTLILCTIPLVVLYEVGIVLARVVSRSSEPPAVEGAVAPPSPQALSPAGRP
ncbi:twin-arginine translocase subunit TatC [bacterium]|nr:twin-arginine translocase subunit TatC [bacterium]